MTNFHTRRLALLASLPLALCLLAPSFAQSHPTAPPHSTPSKNAHPSYKKHDITYYWNQKAGKYQNHSYDSKSLKGTGPRGTTYTEKGKTYYWNVKYQKYQNHPYNR